MFRFIFIGIVLVLGLSANWQMAQAFSNGHNSMHHAEEVHQEGVSAVTGTHDCCITAQPEHQNHGEECDGDCSMCACAACSASMTGFTKTTTIQIIGSAQTTARSYFLNMPAYYSIWVPPKIS